MFGFGKGWRRKRLLKQKATTLERDLALNGAWQWSRVPREVQDQAIAWMRIFREEKNFEGCGGFKLTEASKWNVASQAAMMMLSYSHWYFDNIKSVLIYPETYVAPGPVKEIGSGLSIQGESYREGEAWYGGPVILNWKDISLSGRDSNLGHQLTVHEFAHQLDMWNSRSADGIPPLPAAIDVQRWQSRFQAEFEVARHYVENGHQILINSYGLTSLAEFFAVASELYFQVPRDLAEYHPNVFALLLDFYQVDWRQWL